MIYLAWYPSSSTVKQRYVASYGEKEWEEDLETWNNSYFKSKSEILVLLKDLTTPSE